MKAVVLTQARVLELQDHSRPTAGPGEVVVRSEYCGICGTDLHASEIAMFGPPVVLGHEFSGVIVELGVDVTGWRVGDRVTVNPNGNICGVCDFCRAGRPNLCHTGTYTNALGVRRNGGMAEFVALSTKYLHLLPDSVTMKQAAWTEPLAVAVRAVRNSPAHLGDSAAVIGGGPIGLLVLQLLKRAGLARIVMVEPAQHRRDTALALGASAVLVPGELNDAESGFDLVFECSGHPTALQTAVNLVRPGGHVRLVGASTKPLSLEAFSALTKEVEISANFIYVGEFAQAIDLLEANAIDVETLTTAIVDLDHFADAFTALRQPDSTIKVLIRTGAAGAAELEE